MKNKNHLYFACMIFIATLFGCNSDVNIVERTITRPGAVQVDAIDVIMEAAESSDAHIRTYAMEGLAMIENTVADNLIVEALNDKTIAVASAAAIAAGDRKVEAARNQLESMIKSDNIMIKLASGYALEKLGDTRFVHWYDKALQSNVERYAGQSCLLLGKLGDTPLRKNSRQQLHRIMEKADQKPFIRLQAAEALARLGDTSIKERLMDFAGSGYADDRLLTVSALKLLGTNECYAMLSVLAYDDQIEVKLSALRALGTLAGEEDIAPTYQALKYQDPYNEASVTQRVRHLAILAIGSFGRSNDILILKEYLSSRDKLLKLTAAIAILEWQKARSLATQH